MYGIRHMILDTPEKIPAKDFKNISYAFLESVIEDVFSGKVVRLPAKMGHLSIVGRKIKPKVNPETGEIEGLAPDWKSTYKMWNKNPEKKEKKEIIYFLNEHTQTIRYRFFWSKKNIYSEYKDFYTLVMCRKVKRLMAKQIFEGKEYFVNNKTY